MEHLTTMQVLPWGVLMLGIACIFVFFLIRELGKAEDRAINVQDEFRKAAELRKDAEAHDITVRQRRGMLKEAKRIEDRARDASLVPGKYGSS